MARGNIAEAMGADEGSKREARNKGIQNGQSHRNPFEYKEDRIGRGALPGGNKGT
jgi:hypothetical protein